MAKHSTTRAEPTIDAPAIDAQDASALRVFIESMIASGAVATLVHWLLALISRLWKTQNDLVERMRVRKRRNGDNEKLARLQVMLPGFDWSAANDNAPKKPEPKDDKRRRGKNTHRDEHGRGKLPENIQRKEEKILVPDGQRACNRCGLEMTLKQWIKREILERIPAQWFVRLILRERLACDCCQQASVAAEPVDTVIDGGFLGTDMLIDATVDHFGDAVPFERMAREARSQGVPLAANTLARNVHTLIDRLQPVVDHVFHRCVASQVVGSDATSMRVLDPKIARGIRHATLWNLLGDERWSFFGYAPTGH
ncbi:MAG: transposase, partial [Deltaproteobacteria bacterium]|nr:transposase [Deltaproteobacteria bacterium]